MERKNGAGFTLLELMIVVVILGILTGLAVLRLKDTTRKAQDGALLGNLGSVRSAMSIYYSDNQAFPSDLEALTQNTKYLAAFPVVQLKGYHGDSNAVVNGPNASVINDAGGWAYDNASGDANFGKIWVNCTHTDLKGSSWTSY